MRLAYEGKKDASRIRELQEEKRLSASPLPSFPIGALIHGDNFEIMARMLNNYEEKIDLAYLDPPYNTQNDFYASADRTAHISYSSGGRLAYSDKMNFEEYLEFIRERISLLYRLLSPSATLYLHIDCKVGHYVKLILDEIFERDNFLNEIARVKSNPKNFQRKAYGNQKDTIYIYAKQAGKNIFNNIKEIPNENELRRLYPKVDAYGEYYATVPCHAPGETKNGRTGGLWRDMSPPPGRHWRCSPSELEALDQKGLIEWSRNNVPRIKKYASSYEGKKIQDVWTSYKDPPYPVYPTEKNISMLEMIIRQASRPDSTVLDCFCGSGSFLAAALRHGRRPIGIDSSSAAIEIAKKREELARLPLVKG